MEKSTAELDATLVLNYVEDEIEMLEIEVLDPPILDNSFDENQNSTHDPKQRSVEDTPKKDKGLVVRLANGDLSPKKIVTEAEEDITAGQNAQMINISEQAAIPKASPPNLKSKETGSSSISGISAKRGRSVEKIKDPEAPLAKKAKTAAISTNKTVNSTENSQLPAPKLQESTTKALKENNLNATLIDDNSQPSKSDENSKKNLKSGKVVKSKILKKSDITEPKRGRPRRTVVKEVLVSDVTKVVKVTKVQKTQKIPLNENVDAKQAPVSKIKDLEPPKKKRGRPKGYSPKKALLSKITKELESSKALLNSSTTTAKSTDIDASQQNCVLNNNLKPSVEDVPASKTGTDAKVFEIFKAKISRPKSSEAKTVEPVADETSLKSGTETQVFEIFKAKKGGPKTLETKPVETKANVASSKTEPKAKVSEVVKAKKGRKKTVGTKPISKTAKSLLSKSSSKSLKAKTKKSVDLKQVSTEEKYATSTQLNNSTSVKEGPKTNQNEDSGATQANSSPPELKIIEEKLLDNNNSSSSKVAKKTKKGKHTIATKTDSLPSTSKVTKTTLPNHSSSAVEVEPTTIKNKDSGASKIDSVPSTSKVAKEKLGSHNSTNAKEGLKTNKAKEVSKTEPLPSTSNVTKEKLNKQSSTSAKVGSKTTKDKKFEVSETESLPSTSKVTKAKLNHSSTPIEEPISIKTKDLEASKMDYLPSTSKVIKETHKHSSSSEKVGPKTKKDNDLGKSGRMSIPSTSKVTKENLPKQNSISAEKGPQAKKPRLSDASKTKLTPSTSKEKKERLKQNKTDCIIETIDLELPHNNKSILVSSENHAGASKTRKVEKETNMASKPSTSKTKEKDSSKTNELDKDVVVVSVEVLKKKRGRSKRPHKAAISSASSDPSSSRPKEIIETINLEDCTSTESKNQKVTAKKTNSIVKSKKIESSNKDESSFVAVKSSTSTSEGPKDFEFLKPTIIKSAVRKIDKDTKSEGSDENNADQKKETPEPVRPKMTCTVATQTLEEEALVSSQVNDSENTAPEQSLKTSRLEENKNPGKKILVSSVEIINLDVRAQRGSTPGGAKQWEPKKVSESAVTEKQDQDETIKIEEDDGATEATPSAIIVEDLENGQEENVQGVKYETVEQIHTEFKYESQSETEEMLKRRGKHGGPMRGKRRGLNKTEDIKGQTTIDSFFKIVDLNGKIQTYNKHPVFKCDHCLYVGNSKANLERHSLIHQNPDEISWFNCTDCPYKSKYKHQLKSHSLIHMKPEEIDFFQCPHCEVKCSRKHNLRNHIKSIHADREYTFSCAECDYSTFSKDRLVAHLKKHSKEVHTCNLCKFVTKRRDYLDAHFKMKHTNEVERPFPCDTCSYKGKTKRELDKHFDRMHNKDQLHAYQCNHCSFNSIYKKNLEFHLLHMHQNSEGFQKLICGHCNKTFVYKNGLKVHIIRCHIKLGDEDWHKCLECKYKSKDVTTLKRHIKRNHGAPRLHCKQCSFATNRQMSMDAHMKTHEYDNEDILKCPECPYRIIQMSSFLYHMKVIHGKPITAKDAEQYYMQED